MAQDVEGAEFIRDVVRFMDNRNEHLNQGKTAKQLFQDFMESTCCGPKDYSESGQDFIGYPVQVSQGHKTDI